MAMTDLLVLRTVNASLPREIDAATLATCLRAPEREEAARTWLAHLSAFFTEVPLPAIESFAARHRIAHESLARAYDWMKRATGDSSRDVEDWLNDLAGPAAERPRLSR